MSFEHKIFANIMEIVVEIMSERDIKIFFLIMKDQKYGRRIVENIAVRGFPHWIYGVHEFEEVPPASILLDETPELDRYLPSNPPECDLILSLGLPSELQATVPMIAERCKAKAVIIAVDDPSWVPPGLKRQLIGEFERLVVAYAFPKPLCSLEEIGDPVIDMFARHFGRPNLKIRVENGVIKSVEVLRGAPCGSTWFIAERLVGIHVNPREGLWEELAKAHHVYPCLASMQMDPELEDTILHKSQYLIREAVDRAVG